MASRGAVSGGDAIYARYSSDLQNPRSTADQVERLRGEIERHGGNPNTELIFTDAETSGTVRDRSGLAALLHAVEQGRVRRIFTEDVSRMSRDPEDQARLRKQLDFHGVQLVSVDGIELDGSSRSARSYSIKGIFAEQYLKDLGDKTRRGLWGNAREGKATGGKTFGYRTGANGVIELDPEQAPIVVRIFELYARGYGYARIAAELNTAGVAPPRGAHRRAVDVDGKVPEGWIASCIREMLRNPKYVGSWSFGAREWKRHPDTRRRVPKERAEAAVLRVDRSELAIVDRELWDRVQALLARHADARKRSAAEGRTPRKPTCYLLSSLLRCACCGGLLEIAGGSPHRYYRCATNRKRGAASCPNARIIREPIARERVLGAIRETVATEEASAYIRKRIGERLGALSREIDAEGNDRAARLARVEGRIKSIIAMQLDGDRSPYLADMRRDFEAQATTERAALAELRARADAPIRLPNVAKLTERVQHLAALAKADPAAARELLRGYLKGGVILCSPDGTGEAELLPLSMMLDDTSSGCAGRI